MRVAFLDKCSCHLNKRMSCYGFATHKVSMTKLYKKYSTQKETGVGATITTTVFPGEMLLSF